MGASFSTTRLLIPSLAPDLLKEFEGGICLNTGRVCEIRGSGAGCELGNYPEDDDDAGASGDGRTHNSGSAHSRTSLSANAGGGVGRQMTALAAAGMTQVVETELLTAGLVDAIKVARCCSGVGWTGLGWAVR